MLVKCQRDQYLVQIALKLNNNQRKPYGSTRCTRCSFIYISLYSSIQSVVHDDDDDDDNDNDVDVDVDVDDTALEFDSIYSGCII